MFDPELAEVMLTRQIESAKSVYEFAEWVMPHLKTENSRLVLADLDREQGNVVAIFETLAVLPDEELHAVAIELFLRLGEYLDVRGLYEQKRQWGWMLVEQARPPELPDELAALYTASDDAMLHFLEKASLIEEEKSEVHTLAEKYNSLGVTLWQAGKAQEAVIFLQKALLLFEKIDLLLGRVGVLLNLSNVFYAVGQAEDGVPLVETAFQLTLHAGDKDLQAQVVYHLANSYTSIEDKEKAMAAYQKAIDLYDELHNGLDSADVKFSYAIYLAGVRESQKAVQLARESLAMMEQHNLPNAVLVRGWLQDRESPKE